MQFILSIGEKILDAIPVNAEQLKEDGYLDSLRRLLLVKHELTIIAYLQTPCFYLRAESGLNKPRHKKS